MKITFDLTIETGEDFTLTRLNRDAIAHMVEITIESYLDDIAGNVHANSGGDVDGVVMAVCDDVIACECTTK